MWHVGAVVSTATSQQEGCGLELALACDKTPTIMSEYFRNHGKDKLLFNSKKPLVDLVSSSFLPQPKICLMD